MPLPPGLSLRSATLDDLPAIVGLREQVGWAAHQWAREDPAVAQSLLADAFRRLPDLALLTANMPTSNRRGVAWLRGLGVEPDPWDGRMARGAAIPRVEEAIYGNAVGALG